MLYTAAVLCWCLSDLFLELPHKAVFIRITTACAYLFYSKSCRGKQTFCTLRPALYYILYNSCSEQLFIKMLKAGTAHTRLCRKVVYIPDMVGHSEYQGSYLRKAVMPFAQLF